MFSFQLLGRTIRVDHVENYKIPKEDPKHEFDEVFWCGYLQFLTTQRSMLYIFMKKTELLCVDNFRNIGELNR